MWVPVIVIGVFLLCFAILFLRWLIMKEIPVREKLIMIAGQILVTLFVLYGLPYFIPNQHPGNLEHQAWNGLQALYSQSFFLIFNGLVWVFYLLHRNFRSGER